MNTADAIAKACPCKPFDTFVAAQRAAKWIRRDYDRARVSPFRCQACQKFHIGEENSHRTTNRGPLRKRRQHVRSHGWTHFNPRRW